MSEIKKLTIAHLHKKKRDRLPITMMTAYDATCARMVDQGGVDVILVGDSLGMVIQGNDNTLSVTVDDMIYHTKAVARGTRRAHIVADMPFLSYQVSREAAISNAGRLLKEGHAESVKLEGGTVMASTVKALVDIGIPVMGHVGLEPQKVHAYGGYKIQGTTREAAEQIIEDALAIADAGAYAIVLEGIPEALAKRITDQLAIPTIGIASGLHCDGQVLVSYDAWGFNPDFQPKFVKPYIDGYVSLSEAVERFVYDVRERTFPASEHTPK